jgi:7-cyano-7-deazaguanine reductase
MTPETTEFDHHIKQRRDALQTTPNTSQGLDYISVLSASAQAGAPEIIIKYVPDKLIIATECIGAYVAALRDAPAAPLEQVALDILGDINNEVVPRWCQIVVREKDAGTNARYIIKDAGTNARYIIVEDRQPNWNNATLLSRIAPL